MYNKERDELVCMEEQVMHMWNSGKVRSLKDLSNGGGHGGSIDSAPFGMKSNWVEEKYGHISSQRKNPNHAERELRAKRNARGLTSA